MEDLQRIQGEETGKPVWTKGMVKVRGWTNGVETLIPLGPGYTSCWHFAYLRPVSEIAALLRPAPSTNYLAVAGPARSGVVPSPAGSAQPVEVTQPGIDTARNAIFLEGTEAEVTEAARRVDELDHLVRELRLHVYVVERSVENDRNLSSSFSIGGLVLSNGANLRLTWPLEPWSKGALNVSYAKTYGVTSARECFTSVIRADYSYSLFRGENVGVVSGTDVSTDNLVRQSTRIESRDIGTTLLVRGVTVGDGFLLTGSITEESQTGSVSIEGNPFPRTRRATITFRALAQRDQFVTLCTFHRTDEARSRSGTFLFLGDTFHRGSGNVQLYVVAQLTEPD